MTTNGPLPSAALRLAGQLFPADSLICLQSRDDTTNTFLRAHWAKDVASVSKQLAATPKTHSVYWGLGMFKESTRRISENIAQVYALAIDVDVHGKPHEHSTVPEAVQALGKFLKQYKLPTPWIVSSGRGLHVYWTLTAGVTAAEWAVANDRLYSAARGAGVKTDNAALRTANALLRMPGSWHPGADGMVEVKVEGTPVELNALLALLPGTTAPTTQRFTSGDPIFANIPIATRPSEFYPTRSDLTPLSLIIKECKQMRTAPNGRYGHWFAALPLAFSTDDEDAVRDWSCRDEHYDADLAALEEKIPEIERMRDGQADRVVAVRCVTLESANPGGCDGCRFKDHPRIKTPWGVGEAPESVAPVVAPTPVVAAATVGATGLDPRFKPVTDVYPDPYREQKEYPYRAHKGCPQWGHTGEGGEKTWVDLASFSVTPMLHEHVPSPGENNTMWRVVDGTRVEDIHISDKVLGSNNTTPASSFLAARSFLIPTPLHAKHFNVWLTAYLKQVLPKLPVRHRAAAFGWQSDGSFVTASRQFTPDGLAQQALLYDTARSEQASMGPLAGTVEMWRTIPETYAKQSNLASLFALMQGFASPLLCMTGQAGVLVHLHSPESGTGKSTVLTALNTIMGDGQKQMKGSTSTTNATYITMAARGNFAVTRDEVTNLSGIAISEYALSVTQGHDKARATKELGLRDTGSWSLIAVTTGNESLRTKLASNKRTDAEAESMRIIEIPFPRLYAETGDRVALTKAITTCRGVAMDVYAAELVLNRRAIEAEVQAALARWEAEPLNKGESAQRFWMADFAAVEIAHRLATKLGLISFPWADLRHYIINTVWPYQLQENRAAKDSHASKDILPSLIAELMAHSVKRVPTNNVRKGALGSTEPQYPVNPSMLMGTWMVEKGYIDVGVTVVTGFIKKDPSNQNPRSLLKQWAKLPHTSDAYLDSEASTPRFVDVRMGDAPTKIRALRFYIKTDTTTTEGD